LSGLEIVFREISVGTLSSGQVVVPCSSGKRVLGGGFQVVNSDIEVHESHPTVSGDGWVVAGFNRLILPGSDPLDAYAICAFSH